MRDFCLYLSVYLLISVVVIVTNVKIQWTLYVCRGVVLQEGLCAQHT